MTRSNDQACYANVNGLQICYDTFGRPSDRPVLLVAGLGSQMITWDEAFCTIFAELGNYVIRFDNRDAGLSTHLTAGPTPDLMALMASMSGAPLATAYSLSEMAADCVGLLAALGLDSAHFIGVSMGGMIAQTAAIEQPQHVRSLISVMSSTGRPDLPGPTPAALEALMRPAPADRDAYLDDAVDSWHVLHGDEMAFDAARTRELAGRYYDRGLSPEGVMRQMAAIAVSGSRVAQLPSITAPTLVIHGAVDPLIPLPAGEDTAALVPGATLLTVPRMGHALPPEVWTPLIEAMNRHIEAVEAARNRP